FWVVSKSKFSSGSPLSLGQISIELLTALRRSSSPENGFIPSILEQPCWAKNYSFLGTCCQLGIRGCWVSRHEQATRNDFWQHDSSNVRLFRTVHEICMDGTTPQLPTSCLSCLKRDCTVVSILTLGKGSRVSNELINFIQLMSP
uniref:Uncharacterized protein n=1 Tax=Cucumis melo TaxID=3656 RepID=A0A9I9CRP3_CUCME